MSVVTNEVLEALLTKLKGIFDTKVDKVSGKGLSTNDLPRRRRTSWPESPPELRRSRLIPPFLLRQPTRCRTRL